MLNNDFLRLELRLGLGNIKKSLIFLSFLRVNGREDFSYISVSNIFLTSLSVVRIGWLTGSVSNMTY